MNIRDDIKQLKTSDRDLRRFGLVVGSVFTFLGFLFLLRSKGQWPWFLGPGCVLIIFGAILPRSLKYIFIAWMSVAFVLGFVASHVVLTLFFFLVITPTGLAGRCMRKDFLALKLDRRAGSYWIQRERKAKLPQEYERQF